MSSVAEFYDGRSVLITGASGFIGKQLLEKLLRSCPDIRTIYVLLRSSKDTPAADRIKDILKSTVRLKTNGSFHAKSTNFEQKSDMTIFDFAEICCNS